MNIPTDVTDDIISTIDWNIVVRSITHRVQTYTRDPDVTPIICIPYYLRDVLFEGWASAYLSARFIRRDNLRIRLVKWAAKSLNVNVINNERYELTASQEAIQRLHDMMNRKESLIVNGIWVRVISF